MSIRETLEKRTIKKTKKKTKPRKVKRELISRAEYARRKGVAPRTIGKYCQKKIIPTFEGKIDPVEADKALEKALVSPLGSGRATGKRSEPKEPGVAKTGKLNFAEARTEEKRLKVEALTMDLQLKKGEMVLTKDVEFAAFTQAREIRDRMLNIPDRVCAVLAAERDETKLRDYLMKQIEAELTSISSYHLKPGETHDQANL